MPAVQLRIHVQGQTIPSKLYDKPAAREGISVCYFFFQFHILKKLFHALDSLNMVSNITKLEGGQISPHNHYSVKEQQAKLSQHLSFLQVILYRGLPWKKA